jgi:hypothetical protein
MMEGENVKSLLKSYPAVNDLIGKSESLLIDLQDYHDDHFTGVHDHQKLKEIADRFGLVYNVTQG